MAEKLEKQGKEFVKFIIDQSGKIANIEVSNSVGKDIYYEAIRVIAQSQNRIPDINYGKAVNVMLTVPITFASNQHTVF